MSPEPSRLPRFPAQALLAHPEHLSVRLTVNAWYQFCQIHLQWDPTASAEALFSLLERAFKRAKKGAGVGDAGRKRLTERYGEAAWFGGGKKTAGVVFIVLPSHDFPQFALVRCYDARSVRR